MFGQDYNTMRGNITYCIIFSKTRQGRSSGTVHYKLPVDPLVGHSKEHTSVVEKIGVLIRSASHT